jgi:hypothetical protein
MCVGCRGGAVQVAPIKPALKAPVTKRLKLKCDEPLLNFAFNSNLRRYTAEGHLNVLIWAREHHCRWDGITCVNAAGGGHLEVLRWARAHGCPWWGGAS